MKLLALIVALYALAPLFLAVMALRWKWKELHWSAKAFYGPWVIAAVVLDIAVQLAATLVFFDWPQEVMFTQRMSRYKATWYGWRTPVARWLCEKILDPFEQGGHCR